LHKPAGFYNENTICFCEVGIGYFKNIQFLPHRNILYWIFLKYPIPTSQKHIVYFKNIIQRKFMLQRVVLSVPVQLLVDIKMLQNSWEWKSVNLRCGDGAAGGLPKTPPSQLPPSQKLVTLHVHP
jgi:hypothetical protein